MENGQMGKLFLKALRRLQNEHFLYIFKLQFFEKGGHGFS
jgi:hypothetical protein